MRWCVGDAAHVAFGGGGRHDFIPSVSHWAGRQVSPWGGRLPWP